MLIPFHMFFHFEIGASQDEQKGKCSKPGSKGWTLDTLKGISSKRRNRFARTSNASSKLPVNDIGSENEVHHHFLEQKGGINDVVMLFWDILLLQNARPTNAQMTP